MTSPKEIRPTDPVAAEPVAGGATGGFLELPGGERVAYRTIRAEDSVALQRFHGRLSQSDRGYAASENAL